MPEDQKPFVHQNGTSTPPGPTPAGTLLHATALATLIEAFETDVAIMRDLALPSLNEDLRIRRRAIETVQLLQEPRVNTTVEALKMLSPSMQALVSDMAIALATNLKGQQALANALRRLIEARS